MDVMPRNIKFSLMVIFLGKTLLRSILNLRIVTNLLLSVENRAKWKFINEAILYLKNKGKKVIVFTNATMPIHVKPTNIVVNGTNLFNNSIKHQIIERIESYRSQGSKITLRFNIDDQFTEEMTKEAVSISKEQADSVSISILFPAKLSRNLGDSVYFPL